MGAVNLDCVVVGAGVVGLAVARALARCGREVVILEAESAIGQGVTARNSEVLHAGMYYTPGSLKAQACVRGHHRLRQEFSQHITEVGKLIVATTAEEEATVRHLHQRGVVNGVPGLSLIDGATAQAMEPELVCRLALFSPHTAVLDVPGLLLSLLADAEAHGATLVRQAPVVDGAVTDAGIRLTVGGKEPSVLMAQRVVLAAGLSACGLARRFGLRDVPQDYLCKGNYFSIQGPQPFRRLIYPVPVAAGLGIHYTVDRSGRGRFGPDVQWVDSEDYTVNAAAKERFATAIARYWPGVAAARLAPLTCGLRPKIHGPDQPQPDFCLLQPDSRLVAMLGIESPGLTSCLALADTVAELLGER